MLITRFAFSGTFVLCIFIAACNVFDGLYDEGASSDPVDLIADARAAMKDGRSDDAVAYLRKAHLADPGSIEVRVELASVLLMHHKIDVLLVAELAHDVGPETESTSKSSYCPDDVACNFDCTAMKSVTSFSYKDSNAYLRLEQVLGVLEEIDRLVMGPLVDLGAEPGKRFRTRADRRALYDALVDHIAEHHSRDKARRLAATLLLDLGITKLSKTVTNIQQSAAARDVTLFHVHRMDGTHVIDYCGPDVEQFITGTMCTVKASAYFTLEMLEARLENFTAEADADQSSIATELVEAGHELFDGLTSGVEGKCGTDG